MLRGIPTSFGALTLHTAFHYAVARACYNIIRKEPNPPTHKVSTVVAIYAPMIYTAPCEMFLMRADPLRGQMGGGWALEIKSILGPVQWHQADRQVPFGAQKIKNHYTQGRINHRCIGSLMHGSGCKGVS